MTHPTNQSPTPSRLERTKTARPGIPLCETCGFVGITNAAMEAHIDAHLAGAAYLYLPRRVTA